MGWCVQSALTAGVTEGEIPVCCVMGDPDT